MRKKYRFTAIHFYELPEIKEFLNKYEIEYTLDPKAMDICEFFLYSDMPDSVELFYEAKKLVEKECLSGFRLIDIENEFNQVELEQAEWIEVNVNSRFQYVEPSECGLYRDKYFTRTEGCEQCLYSYKQVHKLSMKKSLRFTGKRKITGVQNVMDEFFINEEIKEALEKSNLKGFEIWPVYNVKRTEYLKNTYQIYIKERLNVSMEPESYEVERTCETCGRKYYKMNGDRTQLVYKKENLSSVEVDIIKSKEYLGMGLYGPKVLISHKMYEFFKEHDMIRNLRTNVVILKD